MFTQSEPVRWAELSELQQKTFGNGCGPEWFPQWLINLLFGWFFEASCRRHDFAYSRGGDSVDRKAADKGFLKAMLRDAERLTGVERFLAHKVSIAFYLFVRVFGWMAFEYGPYFTLGYFFLVDDE